MKIETTKAVIRLLAECGAGCFLALNLAGCGAPANETEVVNTTNAVTSSVPSPQVTGTPSAQTKPTNVPEDRPRFPNQTR